MLCELYVKLKFCKQYDDKLEQYEAYSKAVSIIDKDKDRMLRTMICKPAGVRDFLMFHSSIDEELMHDVDWFSMRMADILRITEEDWERLYGTPNIPKDIMDKLSIFDPKPIGFVKENIRIEYDFWAKNAINIIDTDWEAIEREQRHDVDGELDEHVAIYAGTHGILSPTVTWEDDDLPF